MTNMNKTMVAAAVAVVAALSFSACSDDTSVGSGVNTKFDEKVGERLGEATTVPTTTPAAGKKDGGGATVTTAPTHSATTSIRYQEVVLSASGFDTNPIRVYVGTPIRFTNKDSKTRSINGTNGEFVCSSVAPGATCIFTPKSAGGIDVETDVPFDTTHIDTINR